MADIENGATDAAQAESRTVDAGRGWEWITEGFDLFKKQPGMWILLMVLTFLIMAVLSLFPFAGAVASAVLFPILGAGFMLGCRTLESGGTLEIKHLFAGFENHTGSLVMLAAFNLAGSILIIMLMVMIIGTGVFFAMLKGDMSGAGISIASVMLAALVALAASIPLYMAAWFAPALVVFRGMAPMAALMASFGACLKNLTSFTVYSVVLLLLAIVAMIPLGLGFLVLVPVTVASIYASYRDIFPD